MTLRDTIRNWLFPANLKAAAQDIPAWVLQTAVVDEWSVEDLQKYETQARFFQTLSWVNGAVSILAETCALGGFEVKRANGEKLTRVVNADFEQLLRKPNPYQSQFELLVDLFSFMSISNNAYLFLNRPSADVPPVEIWNIPPGMIYPDLSGKLGVESYTYMPGDGSEIRLEPFEVCHFHGFNPFLRWVGLSRLESLAPAMTTDLAMQRYSKTVYTGNGKLPGVLAFAENYSPAEWANVKRQVETGAKNQTMMLLYNVKQGGVNWISTAMSASDMQQLETRTANQREIYQVLAPGLMSILSENATEANAIAGRRTFIDFACWPKLQMAAQKITQAIMPSYGEGFVCEPIDIRITDQQMKLAEMQQYSSTHTVDEIRVKYWDDKDLGDLRGELFPAQITPDIGNGEEPEEPEPEAEPIPMPMLPEAPQPAAVEQPEEPGEPVDMMPPESEAAMMKWQRYAVNRYKAGQAELMPVFSGPIPSDMRQRVETALKAAQSLDDVQAAFSRPRDDVNLWAAIQAIREATRVLKG